MDRSFKIGGITIDEINTGDFKKWIVHIFHPFNKFGDGNLYAGVSETILKRAFYEGVSQMEVECFGKRGTFSTPDEKQLHKMKKEGLTHELTTKGNYKILLYCFPLYDKTSEKTEDRRERV